MKPVKKDAFDPSFFHGVAHRGLHDESATENGMKAFELALDHGYAFELDIHLSKDGQLVVCHDADLLRTTGKPGRIEDLDYEEIEADYRLLDGGKVPLYQDVLDLVKEQALIVTELKVVDGNYRALAEKTKQILAQISDSKKIVLISFDPRVLWALGKDCRFLRGLLLCAEKKDRWFIRLLPKRFHFVSLEDKLVGMKKFIAYRKKGYVVNSWTIDSEEKLNRVLGNVDSITFQGLGQSRMHEVLPIEEETHG